MNIRFTVQILIGNGGGQDQEQTNPEANVSSHEHRQFY